MKFYNRTQELTHLGTIETKCVLYGNGRSSSYWKDLVIAGICKGDEISLLIRISHQRAAFMPTISERCGGSTGNTDIRNDYPIQGSV